MKKYRASFALDKFWFNQAEMVKAKMYGKGMSNISITNRGDCIIVLGYCSNENTAKESCDYVNQYLEEIP